MRYGLYGQTTSLVLNGLGVGLTLPHNSNDDLSFIRAFSRIVPNPIFLMSVLSLREGVLVAYFLLTSFCSLLWFLVIKNYGILSLLGVFDVKNYGIGSC
jgi:hypothetical protein